MDTWKLFDITHRDHLYITWGRETLGWALYFFEKPRSQAVRRPRARDQA